VETEAYLTLNDEACHTFTRPSTRAFVERNAAGAAYIYMNYGVHWMLNVLVKGGVRSGLILVRALQPRRGLSLMRARRGVEDLHRLCSGPGKLAQALDITKRHHEMSLCADQRYCFMRPGDPEARVVASPRIGITRATAFPWRFTLADSPFISVPVRLPKSRKPLTARRTARTFPAS
jgi:DNA-3-methyladenine glycosylase